MCNVLGGLQSLQDGFVGIRPAFLCVWGRGCCSSPGATDLGEVTDCKSLLVCCLLLSASGQTLRSVAVT